MKTLLLGVLWAAIVASPQTSTPSGPLWMRNVHPCEIHFAFPAATAPRWGGQIAIYDVTTDSEGAAVRMTRRDTPERERMQRMTRLDEFETCVKAWRFGDQAAYEVSLFGGTILFPSWNVLITKGDLQLTIRMRNSQ